MQRVQVQVHRDHLERMVGAKKPLLAIAELAWNAVDADANRVDIILDCNPLGGLEAIRVSDDGHGFSHAEALDVFKKLGGSWKRGTIRSRGANRVLHGRAGEGRFRALALGNRVAWTTSYKDEETVRTFNVSTSRDDLGFFSVSEPVSAGPEAAGGTTVTVTSLTSTHASLLSEKAAEELAQLFALYLRKYPDIQINYDGKRLDPKALEAHTEKMNLPPITLDDGREIHASLEIIEWRTPVDRALVLCDDNGFAFAERPPGIQAPGFNFTAYVKSDLIRELEVKGVLQLEELDPELRKLLDPARVAMRDYFRKRAAENASSVVEEWKREKVYPFQDPPKTLLEETERQVFDVVALNLHSYLPNFEKTDPKNKKLSLTLLRQGIESGPEAVRRILRDVLELPIEKQEELAGLLDRTTLSAIISSAKIVGDRLDFLHGLEALLFDHTANLKERSQLHRILAEQTWIFGEEYTLSVDDESLTRVLEKHLEAQGRGGTVGLHPVLTPDGSRGIVDLMLSRLIVRGQPKEREHLVIELKRPSERIDLAVEGQVLKYVMAVAKDPRFRDTKTSWEFWAVSNEMDDLVREKARQPNRPQGVLFENEEHRLRVWVKTWGELLEECRARLHFFQQHLSYSANRDSGLEYVRRVHAKYLPASAAASAPSATPPSAP